MAVDKKISELTALTTPDNADVLAIVDTDATETKKITWANIKTAILAVYGTPVASEAMGGSGTTRTLAHAPISGTLLIADGAAILHNGIDYTWSSGTNVVFTDAPSAPIAYYRYA
jgi:hypothetical protein